MTPVIWTGAFIIVGVLAVVARLNATYDQVTRAARNDVCGCPLHDAGSTCAKDGAL